MRHSSFILMLCALVLCTACGKRPDVVDAPDGANPKAFPRIYPDTSTDPAGRAIPKN